ncbi:MAG: hypothetical protein F6J93_07035 [Oscillatoria sp. SIO1A7]|nr:hypothetical protein [Oscillatoria sp. SIO1A7]
MNETLRGDSIASDYLGCRTVISVLSLLRPIQPSHQFDENRYKFCNLSFEG